MIMHRTTPSGFTAIEALVMIATLFIFTMIVAALWNRYQRDPSSMPSLSGLTASPVSAPAPNIAPSSTSTPGMAQPSGGGK